MAGAQVTVAATQIDKQRLGYSSVSLTNYGVGNTSEPQIAAGSKVEIAGALYEFTSDESITGWAGLTSSAIAYILLTASGSSVSASFTNTAPTWDAARQGWYTSTNRVVAMLYKDAAGLYQFKNLIPQGQSVLEFAAVINSTVNPFVFNLPASSATGRRIRVVCTSILSTGLVQIAPNGTDQIGSAGNVSCYLNNVDQSGFVYKGQFLELEDSRSGYWGVLAGQLCPANATDTNGQQYHLGKLHHLPLANVTSRMLTTPVPSASSWSSAITAAGVLGVPANAKGVRLRVHTYVTSSASGRFYLMLSYSDNNSNTPAYTTAHPAIHVEGHAAAPSNYIGQAVEIDVPLNSSGQFYIYGTARLNVNPNASDCYIVGFYTGD
jgi:hypothetical protein